MRDGAGIGRSIVADEPMPTIVRSAPDVPLRVSGTVSPCLGIAVPHLLTESPAAHMNPERPMSHGAVSSLLIEERR